MRKLIALITLVTIICMSYGTNVKATEISANNNVVNVDMDEYYMLAHLINAEAGSTYCSDTLIYYVGSVVLNRMKDEDFPNTMEEVIYQKGQYQCIKNGMYDKEPSERCWNIAYDLLLNGSKLPQYVVFQAESPLGSWYCKEQNMYFCTKKGTK